MERSSTRVLIAGGGFAALEAALALRALAGNRVELALVSSSPRFVYRPAATATAFGGSEPVTYDLRQVAEELGARYHDSALAEVSPREPRVRLASGMTVDYDTLILATGARALVAVPGALTFRNQRDIPRFRAVLDQLMTGGLRRLVFTVPSNHTWPLPVYELALMSSHHAEAHGAKAEIVIISPESAPLAMFGEEASWAVADLLHERGIAFRGGCIPHSVERRGSLALQFDAPVKADRVVALPVLQAARVAGVPSSWAGFVPTDPYGRVEGLANVYAAGDMTTFPIKQGGIAAQQADRIAHTVAAGLGCPLKELREPYTLRARLLTGEGALVLRTELDALGRPTAASVQHVESRQAEELKVFGRYLTPYLSTYGSRVRTKAAA